jgi:hypothetical protein
MAAPPPRPPRRRVRKGSLERPVSGRMYRGTWLLVGLPMLVAAFSVQRPQPLPEPALPPTFDGPTARALAVDLAKSHPDRRPGSAGATGAAEWLVDQLRPYGFAAESTKFTAEIPGRGRVQLENIIARVPAQSPQTIVVMAHRDNLGEGPGANDNASGTAALVELARAYANPVGATSGQVPRAMPTYTIVFLSTDGGAFGGIGAAHFARTSPYRDRVVAVIDLDTIAERAPPRLQIAGDRPRSPAATLVATAAARLLETTGVEALRPSALRQLIDLGFPFTLYEQGPFLARGISALAITTAGDAPPPPVGDEPATLDGERLGQVGLATQALLGSLDGGLELAHGTSSYVYLGARTVPGWAVQLVLIATLLPFLAATVDLFARTRRLRIKLAPAFRSYRSRLGLWLFAGISFAALAVVGAFAGGEARPLAPQSAAAREWRALPLLVFGVVLVLAWLTARERLLPRREVAEQERIGGYTAALLMLALVSLLVAATDPYALVFFLPSLHAWLWLPNLRDRRWWLRAAVLLAGFAGLALLFWSFAGRFGLGLDAPWYVAQLAAVGYVDPLAVVVFLAWLAAAAQLAALVSGRYAPYPAAGERPPRGPLREATRRLLLVFLRSRRAPEEGRRALHP